ncbi:MAG TPA: TerC family protein [Gemmatimonadaceae bacterium]|nr:TerC family protein [Gemmatimonadaceae bacterium]
MEWIADPQAWIGLLTLTVLEIVLGIDNIIFISILSSKLPRDRQPRARRLGLLGAFFTRILLLLSIAWIVKLTTPLFTVMDVGFSGRALILLLGGLFLIAKATYEIHDKLEGTAHADAAARAGATMTAVIVQIMIVDIVFSLDSVITAVGMSNHVEVMIAANVIALGVMLMAATPISDFVDGHPTVKMLALSFLVLIGTNLVAEALGHHIPKGYTYFAMAFSVLVEMLNLRLRAREAAPVKLHDVPRSSDVLPGGGA